MASPGPGPDTGTAVDDPGAVTATGRAGAVAADRVGMARPAGGMVADAKAGAGGPETDGGRDGGTTGVLVAPGAGAGGAGPGLGMAEEAGADGAGVAVWLVLVPVPVPVPAAPPAAARRRLARARAFTSSSITIIEE